MGTQFFVRRMKPLLIFLIFFAGNCYNYSASFDDFHLHLNFTKGSEGWVNEGRGGNKKLIGTGNSCDDKYGKHVHGSAWACDCNRCWCNNGKISGTMKGCIKHPNTQDLLGKTMVEANAMVQKYKLRHNGVRISEVVTDDASSNRLIVKTKDGRIVKIIGLKTKL